MGTKHNKLAICFMLTIGLAGCGQHHDKANMSVQDMINAPNLLTEESNWCGQQPQPGLIAGCRNTAIAQWIMKDPVKMAQIGKPEPWAGKNTEFFVLAIKAETAQKMIPLENSKQREESKVDLSAVPANAIHANEEEEAWCITQLALKGQDPLGDKLDFGAASPTCKAKNKTNRSFSPF